MVLKVLVKLFSLLVYLSFPTCFPFAQRPEWSMLVTLWYVRSFLTRLI